MNLQWLDEKASLASGARRELSLFRKGTQEGTHILGQFFPSLAAVW